MKLQNWSVVITGSGSGIAKACAIAFAADNDMLCIPRAFKTGVLVAASIQLIAALPHTPFLEFSVTESAIRKGVLTQPFVQKDGYAEVPQTPGFGIELNPEIIRKYDVSIK